MKEFMLSWNNAALFYGDQYWCQENLHFVYFSKDYWSSSKICATITATGCEKQPLHLLIVSRILKLFDKISLETVKYIFPLVVISQSERCSLVVIYDNGFHETTVA